MGLNPPINPSYECSTNIFASRTTPFPDVQLGLPSRSPTYSCMGKQLQNPTVWLGIFGGALMVRRMTSDYVRLSIASSKVFHHEVWSFKRSVDHDYAPNYLLVFLWPLYCPQVIWMGRGLQASILIGILFITFISWIPNHGATDFQGSPIPGGQAR
jgi:hypothetical protein